MFQNPYFQIFISLFVSIVLYLILSESGRRKRVADFFSDNIFNMILLSFAVNAIFNFNLLLSEPYNVVFLQSKSVNIAYILITFYVFIKYHRSLYKDSFLYQQALLMFSLLLLVNEIKNYFNFHHLNFLLLSIAYLMIIGVLILKKLNIRQLNLMSFLILLSPILILGKQAQFLFNFPIQFITQLVLIVILLLFHLIKGEQL